MFAIASEEPVASDRALPSRLVITLSSDWEWLELRLTDERQPMAVHGALQSTIALEDNRFFSIIQNV
jgi:hypothetical protein